MSSSIISKTNTSSFDIRSPDQMRRRKIVKKGFRLTLMVCGHSGTGKSTFINTLCEGEVYPEMGSTMPPSPTMEIGTRTIDLNEPDGTVITLSVVDTPGFGDNIDNSKCCHKIIDYLKKQFDEILEEESRVKRNPRFVDNRVHVALYFIAATGHGLRELDIEVMTALSSLVNVIPVISKADTLTTSELEYNKKVIMQDITDYNIPIYYFSCDPNDDECLEECMALRELVPFAIVGSNESDKEGHEFVRVRRYPWGMVRIEDTEHSDFIALRSVLFGSHLQELRDITHDVLYEKYRTDKLSDSNTGYEDEQPVTRGHRFMPQSMLSNGSGATPAGGHGAMHMDQRLLRDIEDKVSREIQEKRKELHQREEQLRDLKQGGHEGGGGGGSVPKNGVRPGNTGVSTTSTMPASNSNSVASPRFAASNKSKETMLAMAAAASMNEDMVPDDATDYRHYSSTNSHHSKRDGSSKESP